jgi:ABC-type siderophore export system fused ATPase/permease subunit
MNQVNEIVVVCILLSILVLKPAHVAAYISSHLGRLLMVATLVYLTMRSYLYGVIALALIVLVHEMRVVEGNENMKPTTKKDDDQDDDQDDTDGDDETESTTTDDDK